MKNKKFGTKSMFFDGTGDYLKMANPLDWYLKVRIRDWSYIAKRNLMKGIYYEKN